MAWFFRKSIRRFSDPFSFRLLFAVLDGRAPSLLELVDRPAAYEDVGRLCRWGMVIHELKNYETELGLLAPWRELSRETIDQFVVERIALAVHGYGIAARSLDLAAAYSRDRQTFGRPLVSNQSVQHTLVEMRRQVEVARTYTRHVAARHVAGEFVVAEACLAKQTAVDCAAYVCDRAVQLFGGAGYMHGTEVERHYRDARLLPIGGGADEVLRDLTARLMGYAS